MIDMISQGFRDSRAQNVPNLKAERVTLVEIAAKHRTQVVEAYLNLCHDALNFVA